jgi:hypothetical protein
MTGMSIPRRVRIVRRRSVLVGLVFVILAALVVRRCVG